MDEMVIKNLVFFVLPLPSPARTITSPALIIPFPPVNKLSNKLAPNVPSNILKNPPLCSLVSFSNALLTSFNKISEFSNAFNNFHNIIHIFFFNN